MSRLWLGAVILEASAGLVLAIHFDERPDIVEGVCTTGPTGGGCTTTVTLGPPDMHDLGAGSFFGALLGSGLHGGSRRRNARRHHLSQ
jgi:hypothetical protein